MQYPRAMSEEELIAIRDFIMLPMLLEICKANLDKLEYSGMSLKKLYVESTHGLMKNITKDIGKTKQFLRQRDIKVIDEDAGHLRYKIICRGYEDSMIYYHDYFKAELGVKLGEYVAGVNKHQV